MVPTDPTAAAAPATATANMSSKPRRVKKSERQRELDDMAEEAAAQTSTTGRARPPILVEDALLAKGKSSMAGRATLKIVGKLGYAITIGKFINRGVNGDHKNELAHSISFAKRDSEHPIRIAVDLDDVDPTSLSLALTGADSPPTFRFKPDAAHPVVYILDGNHRYHAAHDAYGLTKEKIMKLEGQYQQALRAGSSQRDTNSSPTPAADQLQHELAALKRVLPSLMYWQVEVFDSSESIASFHPTCSALTGYRNRTRRTGGAVAQRQVRTTEGDPGRSAVALVQRALCRARPPRILEKDPSYRRVHGMEDLDRKRDEARGLEKAPQSVFVSQ